MLYPKIQGFLEKLNSTIPEGARSALWGSLIEAVKANNTVTAFNFICTHNARRSALSQSLATAIFHLNGLNDYTFYSGGAEETFIHPNTIVCLEEIGFQINKLDESENPRYEAYYSDQNAPIQLFSKTFDDKSSDKEYFALLVCSKGDKACPFIPSAAARILIPFNDPGDFDSSPNAKEKYLESATQIGEELSYFVKLLKV